MCQGSRLSRAAPLDATGDVSKSVRLGTGEGVSQHRCAGRLCDGSGRALDDVVVPVRKVRPKDGGVRAPPGELSRLGLLRAQKRKALLTAAYQDVRDGCVPGIALLVLLLLLLGHGVRLTRIAYARKSRQRRGVHKRASLSATRLVSRSSK